jgi:hypothetical protein
MQGSGTDREPLFEWEGPWPPTAKDWASPWRIHLWFEAIDGRIECTRFLMWMGDTPDGQPSPEGQPVTATALRGVNLGTLIDGLPRAVREQVAAHAQLAAVVERMPVEPRRVGRKPLYDRDHWRKVAEVYRKAAGRSPTKAVADHFNVSRATASGWVRRARDAGALGETEERRAGEHAPSKKGTKR